jgi:hypothetical protein
LQDSPIPEKSVSSNCPITGRHHEFKLLYNISYVSLDVSQNLAVPAGSDIVPPGVSSRAVHITAYFMSMVVFTSYSGALVSSIASRHATLPFKTFQDFLNDGTYRLGVVANSSIISNMKVRHIGSP